MERVIDVSIVVRTKNRPHLLPQALASLAASEYRHIDVVLVNDGGAPPTVPDRFPLSVTHVNHAESQGRAAAAQAGVDHARGRYVGFLDDDDLVHPDHVSTLVDAMQRHGVRAAYTDAVATAYEFSEPGGWICVARAVPYSHDFDRARVILDNYIPLNTVLVERALLVEAGPFDRSFDIFEDWDMLIRLSALAPFLHIARVTCEMRHFRGASDHALGEVSTRARLLAKHRAELDDESIVRVIADLRAETVAAERRASAEGADRGGRDKIQTLERELTRVYGEEARLSAEALSAHRSSQNPRSVLSLPSRTAPRKVSVVIVSWNGRSHLETCLRGLASQHAPGLACEHWVFDNGSDDGTMDWLSANYPDVKVIRSPVNLGFCAANNRIVAETDADLLVFLNNDTLPEPDWLGELVTAIADAPADVAAVTGLIVDWSGKKLDFGTGVMAFDGYAFQVDLRRPLGTAARPVAGQEQLFGCGANLIVRRESFLAAGGFDDEFFAYFDDVDLGWRFWSGGERVISAPRAIVRHRHASSGAGLGQKRDFLVARNSFLTVYKNYDSDMWASMMPALMMTLVARTMTLLNTNPALASAAADPFAAGAQAALATGAPGTVTPRRRWLPFGERVANDARLPEALLDRGSTAQLRTLDWLGRNMDALAHRRRAVQSRRQRPDAEIFEKFPLHLVPIYPGDSELFQSAGFQALLPQTPRLRYRTLADLVEM